MVVGAALLLLPMVLLRCAALDSDAYPRLSWSSALLTDEGFYLHNARNRVLFGHAQTDQFNNALIMPALDAVQTGVFHLFGVGAVQARAVSVTLGLLTLFGPLAFAAHGAGADYLTFVFGESTHECKCQISFRCIIEVHVAEDDPSARILYDFLNLLLVLDVAAVAREIGADERVGASCLNIR